MPGADLGEWLKRLDELVWGSGLLVLLGGTGIYLMLRLRFLPLRNLGHALGCVCGGKEEGKDGKGGVSPFSSLTTELAATIGIGNIVGVATAMTLGGPGALFWMMLAAVVGLATKFTESTLCVFFRVRGRDGRYRGGPMYVLERGLKNRALGRALACLYALFAVFASFGMGNMTQANSIADSLRETCHIPPLLTGAVLGALTLLAALGGIGWIAGLTRYLVPGMALFYLAGVFLVIGANWRNLIPGLGVILRMAFTGRAAAGGLAGGMAVSVQSAVRYGVSRGVFSNEAGLGAAGISAAAAQTSDPVRQGYISMTGVFFDTIVLCSLTGLAILSSGLLGDGSGGERMGAALVIEVFSTAFGRGGGFFVSLAVTLFAFATIIAWEYQGECAFSYLIGENRSRIGYRVVYSLAAVLGAVCSLEAVWDFSDLMNGLMAVPNLIGALALSKSVCRMAKAYELRR